jgi:hypothetical protein
VNGFYLSRGFKIREGRIKCGDEIHMQKLRAVKTIAKRTSSPMFPNGVNLQQKVVSSSLSAFGPFGLK